MDGYIADQQNISEPEVTDTLEALGIEWQIFFIILYSLIAFLALFENLVVIIVQTFGKNFEPILRKSLINLAVADICVGVLSVPFLYTDFMLGHWIFPRFMCPVSQVSVLLSVFVSCYTLTLISFERYILIVHPIFYTSNYPKIQTYSSKLLLIGWILGSIFAAVSLRYSQTLEFHWKGRLYFDCRMVYGSDISEKVHVLLVFTLTFLLPLVLQTTFYSLIGLKLKNMRSPVISLDKIKVIKMLSYLVIMFAVCWLPIRVFFLVVIFNKQMIDFKTTLEYHIYVFAFFGAHFLAMFNSCVNPIVYCFVSKNFRDDFWEIMAKTRLKIFRKTPQNPLNRKPIESTEL